MVSDEPEIFSSIEDVLASLKSEGFNPVISDTWISDITGTATITVDLYCEHGHSAESREYWTLPDGRLECVECSYDLHPCPLCTFDLI